MRNEPKISVIVPVYKVEPYLRKCLDSIASQTYRNLQIILVDDGSPDNCGAICDEYAAKDERIEVLHQENGGVSAARNAGLSLAVGDYIGWVDSDDWIEPDMYEYMLKNILRYQADIAVCGRLDWYKMKSRFHCWSNDELYYKEQALELLLRNDIMQNSLCDKLWRKEMFANIFFPLGKTYEDMAVMYQLFIKADKVVCLKDAKYNYRRWSGGIMTNRTLDNRINHFYAAKNRYDEMAQIWPQFEKLLAGQCVASAISVWCSVWANPKSERKKIERSLREIALFAKEHLDDALQGMKMGLAGRIVLRLIPHVRWWAFGLAGFVSWLYKLKYGRYL